ncbi:MAG: DUF1446 domain-containing protein [Flavobacteriales bacterium]|nr:DUF1446 domain-containing protein [Flavobacteriales bacterium]
MSNTVRIAGGQGFYGDSPMAAIAIAKAKAADYIVHDALAELTLSILQKDKMKDPNLGYARDIEFMAKNLYPLAVKNGIKIVTNSGGLNPENAAKKVSEILSAQGITGVKIASISGDDFISRLEEVQQKGNDLAHLDNGEPFSSVEYQPTHANVYIGARSVVEALEGGADIILAGRVADPCLTCGILAHHFGWNLEADLDKLASGIAVGHLLECGGQASGGNSYAEWPMDYKLSNLGYPIAEVSEDGSAVFSRLEGQGGKMSRNTLREQMVYEIHDPANYLTPDVTVDLTAVKIEDLGENQVGFSGVKGKPRPEQLKLTIGLMEGFLSEQFFFMSWPYAYKKAVKMVEAVKEIWAGLGIPIERMEHNFIGLNGIHAEAINIEDSEVQDLNEVGVRLCIKHKDAMTGKLAMQSIVCLGLNGPPGIISKPGWGKPSTAMLSLWPTLVDRDLIKEKVDIIES